MSENIATQANITTTSRYNGMLNTEWDTNELPVSLLFDWNGRSASIERIIITWLPESKADTVLMEAFKDSNFYQLVSWSTENDRLITRVFFSNLVTSALRLNLDQDDRQNIGIQNLAILGFLTPSPRRNSAQKSGENIANLLKNRRNSLFSLNFLLWRYPALIHHQKSGTR